MLSSNGLLRQSCRNGAQCILNKPANIAVLTRCFSSSPSLPSARTELKKNYPEHVPLTLFGRAFLAVGSGIGAFLHPERGDLIATLGEATASPYFINQLRDTMLSDSTGRRILRDRPRITSKSLNLEKLRAMEPGTVGRTYIEWLDKEGVSPDTRAAVRYIDNEESAYVMQRYRESHDFYHALTGLPIIIEGEIALKAFEYFNTGIPMTGLGALLAPLRLKPKQRKRFRDIYLPWAMRNGTRSKPVINVYWEECLEMNAADLRKDLGIEQPPDLRELRKKNKRKPVSK
ncbi:ubiquinone biosynthesis protein COQ4, mitochondrial [Nadsonia fulvescens var. elongata DSM 6958]|uniref:4-hydroxy-3-methoxy-5-polyprenylbenzoate decarboxylase n=1 Tax=Nadsonia fulvescens var. elongata DSM 6958 TaxID=857566 RepID=A0A1E3PDJ9_9ASCO|nr:ubiquinone biosynthesis protein COQ4, mitochondrial [Nadsonia fulvescens var. elongata DSM 6958]